MFYQNVHDHDVLIDEVLFPKGGKMQISPILDLSCTNQDQIRNQRPRLRRNELFLDRKERAVFFRCAGFSILSISK